MNTLASEYSSGCDSGWTVYLEQSVLSPNDHHTNFIDSKTFFHSSGKKIVDEDDDDDQSMVSDASSGPPPLTDDFNNSNGYFSSTFEDLQSNTHHGGKRKKTKEQRCSRRGGKDQDIALYLDDTASSPTSFSKKNFALINKHQASMNGVLEYSQGFSATRFKGRSK